MASAENQTPTCPICDQSDQVKTMQAAYDAGVTRAAPPDMPTRKVSMMKYIISGGFTVGLCSFLIIILIGSEAGISSIAQWVIVCLTFICIVTTLAISYVAFDRVVQGDAEATKEFPAWDRAMNTWKGLYYCARDNAVFDPAKNSVVSEEQLALLRTLDPNQAAVESATMAH
ncbi:MAG: hypothetical protein JO215_02610 [Ktedonobacteraceae bacterium]|nr:hypothetical protein [Ktedonobacteraceae bacterium]MBV9616670.1 hypothetical protein [Ktedonobacteraceae bacterium]MBV9710042.1 hypothetical protein [Ktedonobacteraceae bacterium]